jgi:hypothetical protein
LKELELEEPQTVDLPNFILIWRREREKKLPATMLVIVILDLEPEL